VVSAFFELLTCGERELTGYGGGPSLAHVPAQWLVSHAQLFIVQWFARCAVNRSVRFLQALLWWVASASARDLLGSGSVSHGSG
jgi:hypothetical protein